jgi:hypothetical protein
MKINAPTIAICIQRLNKTNSKGISALLTESSKENGRITIPIPYAVKAALRKRSR